jgi:hypothetical protein
MRSSALTRLYAVFFLTGLGLRRAMNSGDLVLLFAEGGLLQRHLFSAQVFKLCCSCRRNGSTALRYYRDVRHSVKKFGHG